MLIAFLCKVNILVVHYDFLFCPHIINNLTEFVLIDAFGVDIVCFLWSVLQLTDDMLTYRLEFMFIDMLCFLSLAYITDTAVMSLLLTKVA